MAHAKGDRSERRIGRRVGSVLLVAVGVLLLAVGAYSAWLRTQVLDTDAWVETSRSALEREEVRSAVAVWTVDEVFARTHPEQALAELLPPRAEALAGPLTSRLRVESYDVAEQALATAPVEKAWVTANRRAHQRFVRIVEGREPIVVEGRNGIQLDLRPLLERIAGRVGVGENVVERIPGSITTVEPQRSAELERGIKALRVLDEWGNRITFIGLAFVLVGIWLSPSRRRAWMWTGGAVAVASWAIGQSRDVLRGTIADALTDASTWKAAIAATWDTASAPLVDASSAGIVIGIGTIVIAWMTGPSDAMVAARRVAAPVLVDRRPLTLAIAAVLALLLVNWIDVIDTRRTSVQLLVAIGIVSGAWAISAVATRERTAAATDELTTDPAAAQDSEVA